MSVWSMFGDLSLEQQKIWLRSSMLANVMEMFWTWVLSTIYLLCLFKSESIAKDVKPIWAVALLFANFPAMAVFW
jgi:hypothetical protein